MSLKYPPNFAPATWDDAALATAAAVLLLLLNRHAKYGPKNIERRGEKGILARIDDKVARLEHSGADFSDEDAEDAWADIAGLALCALIRRRGWWKLPLCS